MLAAPTPQAPPPAPPGAQSRARLLAPAFVLLIGMLVAMPGWWGGFHADDWFQIRPRPFAEVLATFVGDWNTGERQLPTGFLRPMVRVSFAFDRMLWGGWAAGYHLTQTALFLAMLAGVYRCGLLLGGGRRWPAAIAACALALTPLRSETLYWLSGRTDLLAAAFGVWSVWCFWRAMERDRPGLTALGAGLMAAAMLTKEVAVVLAAAVPLSVLLFRRAGRWNVPALLGTFLPVAVLAAYVLLRWQAIGGIGGYYGSRVEAVSMGEAMANLGVLLGAVLHPHAFGWRPAEFSSWAGGLWVAAWLALVWVSRGYRPYLALGGMAMLAVLPMYGLRISPLDGSRVLLLGLCFQAMLLAAVLGRGYVEGRALGLRRLLVLGGVLAVAAVGWLPATGRDAREFTRARDAAYSVQKAAWARIEAAPAGSRFLLTDPTFEGWEGRRILAPGVALFLGSQTLAVESGRDAPIRGEGYDLAGGGGVEPTRVRAFLRRGAEGPMTLLRADAKGRLQAFELGSGKHFSWPDGAESLVLNAPAEWASGALLAGQEARLGMPLVAPALYYAVVEFTAEGDGLVVPVVTMADANGSVVGGAAAFPVGGTGGARTWVANIGIVANPAEVRLRPSLRNARFTLRSAHLSVYPVGSFGETGALRP